MYNKNRLRAGSIRVNDSTEGETIEQKIERVVNNGDPITDGAPIIYTERKDGVLPGFDVRTDRFEVAIEAMDKVDGSNKAKRAKGIEDREKLLKDLADKQNGKSGDVGNESTQGTNGDSSK